MKIELFTFVYNDGDILPFFIRHYAPIVDKMTFIDSGSTDGTLNLIKDYEVIQTGLTWWDWTKLHAIRSNIWAGSKYDLVFFPDVDEFFYRQNLREFLEADLSDIYQMEGYQMVSKSFPVKGTDILDIKTGIPLPLHNKYTIFNPTVGIQFTDAHSIAATSAKICRLQIKLLHYKYLGVENMLRRAKLIQDRVPVDSYCKIIKGNILTNYPSFVRTRAEYEKEIDQMLRTARKVI